MTKTVPEALCGLATIYEERNALYGNNYKSFGRVIHGLFPDGLTLKNMDDWNRMGVLIQVVAKLTRYTNRWGKGGHSDSLDDLAVYAMMLQELDAEIKDHAHFAEMLFAAENPVAGEPVPEDEVCAAVGEFTSNPFAPIRPGWPIKAEKDSEGMQ